MTSPPSYPVPTYEVAFDTDPLAAPTYANLSSRLLAYSYGYGKQSATGEFQPGWMRTLLKNDDRVLDKLNAAGTYYGKLNPRKRERLKLTVGGVTYDQMTTFGDGWPMSQFTPATSVIEHKSTDVTVILAGVDLPDTVWMLEASADACWGWWRLNETDGAIASDVSGSRHHGTYNFTRVDDLDNVTPPAIAVGSPLVAFDASTTLAARTVSAGSFILPPVMLDEAPDTLPVAVEALLIGEPAIVAGQAYVVAVGNYNGLYFSAYLYAAGSGDAGFAPKSIVFKSGGAYRSDDGAAFDLTDRPHHVVWKFGATFDTIYVDGVHVATTTTATTAVERKSFLAIAGNQAGFDFNFLCGRAGDVRVYDDSTEASFDATRIAAHADAALTPWTGDTTGERLQRLADYLGLLAADVSFDAGTVTLGPTGLGGDAWAYMQQVARTEAGDLFVEHRNAGKLTFRDCYESLTASRSTTPQAVFTDDPAAAAGAYRFEPDELVLTDDESQVINEAVVKWAQGEARYLDETSKGAHGLKSRTFDTLLATQQEAQSYAEWIVDHYKDAPTRVESITLNPGGDQTLWVPALGLRYGDRVTFRFKPQNTGTAIQTDYLVCGMVADADPQARQFKVTYYLSPVDIQRPYAVWGTGLWGTATWGK